MTKCGFCNNETKQYCPSCNTLMCEKHQHSDPWRSFFRQGIICEKCYKKRIRIKNSFTIPFILLAAIGVGNAVDLKIGFKEPSMWLFINAFAMMTTVISVMTFIYGLISKKRDIKVWGLASVISGMILGISYYFMQLFA